MPKVRVTLFQDPIEVPDDEVPVLRAQGLLSEEAAAATESLAATVKATPRKDAQSS